MGEQESNQPAWTTFGASVRGSSHMRDGLPNQDAIALLPEDTGSASIRNCPIIAAVSDGHGSKRYIRSEHGARLAVKSVTAVLREFYGKYANAGNVSSVKREAEETIPRLLVSEWRNAVDEHLATQPFTEDEYAALTDAGFTNCHDELSADPHRAYGATLIGVLVTQAWLLYAQLGDGDILAVDSLGVASRPIPRTSDDPVGEETHSLCQAHAYRFVQIRVAPLEDIYSPAMILASTDGLSKSYIHDKGFLQIGGDLLKMIQTDGIDSVKSQLPGLLDEVSQAGSGDDITLAGAVRHNLTIV